jgi:Ca2+-binding EF-hand superfamily protein
MDERELELRFLFDLADRDGGGTIEKEELLELLKTMRINASQSEIDYWLGENDKDDDGLIDFSEFCAAFQRQAASADLMKEQMSKDKMLGAFRLFEGVQSEGKIHPRVLVKALVEYGEEGSSSISASDAAELVQGIEVDADGLIDYTSLVNKVFANSEGA